LISAELTHRRLGYIGSYKGRINKDKLGEDVDTKECFDCEPCYKAKSKKIVSREKQARATKVGQLVYVDLHLCKPKGLSKIGKQDREHAMIITDDASRFRTTICITKKGEVSPTLILWAETFKNYTGYYPMEWRFDNRTEFLHFQKWAKEKNLTISTSSAYTHE
jgi:transposase InsO family protein